MIEPQPDRSFWCDICDERPQTGITADGVAACTECQLAILDKIAEQAGATLIGPNRAQRRAMQRRVRRHNDGSFRA